MTTNPYSSPQSAGETPQRKRGPLRVTLVEVLVVVALIGIVVALFLPARRTVGEAARRTICSNNLKQIGLALQNYEAFHHTLPPAYTVDAEGKPLHSWRTLILPFMEQQPLYDIIDLSKPWDDPVNQAARETSLAMYHCHSVDCPATHTTYLAVVGTDGCFRPTEPRKLGEITDDHGLTLMIVEFDAKQAVHWMSPIDTTEEAILKIGTVASLPHREGAHALCVSGATRFVTADSKAEHLRALISIAGNDDAIAREAN